MFAQCPNCDGIMELKHEEGSIKVYECTNCGKTYKVSNGMAMELHSRTKTCPNCKGTMILTKDKNRVFYQNPEAEYYRCQRCGNLYATSGGQLNDSKFNARRASDADNSEKGYALAFICLILIIGYVIYGVFFGSLNYIILAILCFVLIISFLCGYLSDNQMYF